MTILKSPNDKNEYRVITLENGLKALLIADYIDPCNKEENEKVEKGGGDATEEMEQDEQEKEGEDEVVSGSDDEGSQSVKPDSKTKMAAAALCVGVGSFSDPVNIPGLAHFFEHMVFMGSKKYPSENAYDSFISKHGGSDNAFTDCERTVYQMEVTPKHFKGALDILANCFISPLLKEDSMDREIEAVDSEFQLIAPSDTERLEMLLKTCAKNGHPMSHFVCGNRYTLKEVPMEKNIDLNKELNMFYKHHYSAHFMTLAVQSTETLDTLEKWVCEIFSGIPKNDLPLEDFSNLQAPFDTPMFNKLYKVIPVKDIHKIEIAWALPPLQKFYRSKPLSYLEFLIGHEGKGSILAELKKQSWAVSLAAGNDGTGFNMNKTCSLMGISIDLTETGMDHVAEVLSLVFQYLDMLRKEGQKEYIFIEQQTIKNNSFLFQEPKDPIDNVESLSEYMQLYPMEHYLAGCYLLFEYNPQVISDCLNELTVDKANITILSSRYTEVDCPEVEFYTKCRYSHSDIPDKWVTVWKNAEINPALHLPDPNKFLASDFGLKKSFDVVHEHPIKILDNEQACIWYKLDRKFKVPKAYVSFYMKNSSFNECALNCVMTDFFIMSLVHELNTDAYAAQMASLSYYVYSLGGELCISVSGFNHKLPLLLDTILTHIAEFNITDDLFEVMKALLRKKYYNRNLKPEKLIGDLVASILRTPHCTFLDRLLALEHITKNAVQDFIRSCLHNVYIEGLIQGNITKEESLSMYSMVKEKLMCHPLPEQNFPNYHIMKLPDNNNTTVLAVSSFNSTNKQSAILNYYQIGPGSIRTSCMLYLLMHIMQEPCFDVLRTQEQIGYDVGASPHIVRGILGFKVRIIFQSTLFSCEEVDKRILKFLDNFFKSIHVLSSDQFEIQRNSLIDIKKCENLNLKEEVSRNEVEVMIREYVFDRKAKEVKALEQLTINDFKDWVKITLPMLKLFSTRIIGPNDNWRTKFNSDDLPNPQNENLEAGDQNLTPQKRFQYLCDANKEDVNWVLETNQFKEQLTKFPECKILS